MHSNNPQYDVMELKSLEDRVVEKNLKAVLDIVDVNTFGAGDLPGKRQDRRKRRRSLGLGADAQGR